MTISSRTPEGTPFCCPICGEQTNLEPSITTGDGCCPRCGHLLWWFRDRLANLTGQPAGLIQPDSLLGAASEADSLETVELVMQLEEEFGVTLPDDAAERIQSVADAIRFLRRELRDREH